MMKPILFNTENVIAILEDRKGATLRAAYELNRNSYGFEVAKEFYDRANSEMLTNMAHQLRFDAMGI